MSGETSDPLAALLGHEADAKPSEQAPQLPLGVAADDPLAQARLAEDADPEAAPSRPLLPQSALIMVVVALVAAGALLVMRSLGLGVKLDFVDVKLDYPVSEDESLISKHEKILQDLDMGVADVQVPLQAVQKNPFEILSDRAADPTPAELESPSARLRRELAARKRKVEEAFSKLRLQSVLSGSVPVARVNNQTVRVGDTVDDAFVVRAIDGRSVTLESIELPGATYTLSIGGR
ncbi:MAG: hypothetical protein D6824_05285 [Planctomycetota bacterium]|nr:MAG: hypothetical protein D6824_05285 [Planctomycetota bacterium]